MQPRPPIHSLKRGCAAALLAVALVRMSAAPVNDNFTNAIGITSFPATIIGDGSGSTIEPGEVALVGSVWWKWTAPFTGRVGIADAGSFPGAQLKVCVGSGVTSLTNLAVHILQNYYEVLNVSAGTTYYFAVSANGYFDMPGPIQFRLLSPPENDNLAGSLPLTGEMVETFGDNTYATMEPGELYYYYGSYRRSLWWTWIATRTGTFRITGKGSTFNPDLHIFTGNTISNLTLAATGDLYETVTLDAIEGVAYHIRILGASMGGAGIARVAVYPPVPPNDDFAARTALSGYPLSLLGTTIGATAQVGDPPIYYVRGGPTVWYEWTAPASGRLTAIATNLTGNPWQTFAVAVFTGTNLSTLVAEKDSGWGGATPMITAGRKYVIGVSGGQGDFRLGLDIVPYPANDAFTNRLVLTGSTPIVTNSNFAATIERGERISKGVIANASIWYEWTAQTNGLVRMLAEGDGFVPTISVYQGKSVNKLKAVANSLRMIETVQVLCSFNAKAGQTYVISVNGLNADSRGRIVFEIDLTTLTITNPIANTSISAAYPPPFQVGVPVELVDGVLTSVEFLAVQQNGQYRSVGRSSNPPFAVVPTNLPAGIITLLAVVVNSDGLERVSVPLTIKVRPENDDFVHRKQVEGYQWTASGTTAQASRERGEPKHGAYGKRGSVWWSWTAPASGEMQLQGGGTLFWEGFKRSLAVYTGPDVAHLEPVSWNKGSPGGRFQAIAGTTYHIAEGVSNPNADLGVTDFQIQGHLRTISFLQPTGVFREPVDLPIVVTNSEHSALVDRVSFFASDGVGEDLLVGSVTQPPYGMVWSNALSGNFTLRADVIKNDGSEPLPAFTQFTIRPANDNFTDATVLHTNFAMLTRRIAGATSEPGEPYHNQGFGAHPSLWWSWTAPALGRLYIGGPTVENIPPAVAVYTGTGSPISSCLFTTMTGSTAPTK